MPGGTPKQAGSADPIMQLVGGKKLAVAARKRPKQTGLEEFTIYFWVAHASVRWRQGEGMCATHMLRWQSVRPIFLSFTYISPAFFPPIPQANSRLS